MSYQLIVRNRATQDLRQLANYILINGDSHAALRFFEMAEITFVQLATTPGIGKVVRLVSSQKGFRRYFVQPRSRDLGAMKWGFFFQITIALQVAQWK